MISERHVFSLSGPIYLKPVDWNNAVNRRSVAASLVQGVSIRERDRQHNRHGPQALAPPWWEFFDFRVIVERYSKSDLPEMEKKKYLVPRDMSVGQFIHILSCRLRLAPGKALFVFVEDTLPQTATLLDEVYGSFRDEDGFLYMCYSTEKTFGYDTAPICKH